MNLTGDETISSRSEPTPPSIRSRVERIVGGQWTSSSAPTQTNRDAYAIAGEAFARVLEELRTLVEDDLAGLEDRLEAAGAPWTPGRVPRWQMEQGRVGSYPSVARITDSTAACP